MEQNLRKAMWNSASKAGLILGLISTVYLFVNQFLGNLSGFMATAAIMALWAAKFAGCVWLMRFFMKRFMEENGADTKAAFRFGMAASLLSAFFFAVISFANVAYISADFYAEQMDTLVQQMAPMMDSNTSASMEKMISRMPQFTFISNLIYCFLYGTVLSLILSKNMEQKDIFADYKPEE